MRKGKGVKISYMDEFEMEDVFSKKGNKSEYEIAIESFRKIKSGGVKKIMAKKKFRDLKRDDIFRRIKPNGKESSFEFQKINDTKFKGLGTGNVYDIEVPKWNIDLNFPVVLLSKKEGQTLIKKFEDNTKGRRKSARIRNQRDQNLVDRFVKQFMHQY